MRNLEKLRAMVKRLEETSHITKRYLRYHVVIKYSFSNGISFKGYTLPKIGNMDFNHDYSDIGYDHMGLLVLRKNKSLRRQGFKKR